MGARPQELVRARAGLRPVGKRAGARRTRSARDLYDPSIASASIEMLDLGALRVLTLFGCVELTTLPESVSNLGALHTLDLEGCAKLTALPECGNLGAMRTLYLGGCTKLKTLPASISQLAQLDKDSRERVEAILRGALARLSSLRS